MVFGPKHDYKIGDSAWIFVGDHGGDMSKGKVVAILDLSDYSDIQYVVEIPTSMDPLLQVRDYMCMRPEDPRVNAITKLLNEEFGTDAGRERCKSAALRIIEMVDGD